MNILIAASRGGGLASMIRGFNVIEDVNPGASLRELTGRAIARIPPPGCATNKTHVYILAGIPDITDKHTSQNRYYRYTECTYTENSNATIARLKRNPNIQKSDHSSRGHTNILHNHTRQHSRIQQTPTQWRKNHHTIPPRPLHRNADTVRSHNQRNKSLHRHREPQPKHVHTNVPLSHQTPQG